MSVIINGTTGITNPNSMTIGNGGGSIATNTAVGTSALAANTSGATNTAVGNTALQANTTGINNSALGHAALVANLGGSENSAYGSTALVSNTSGSSNTAVGRAALYSNTTASNNTAVGFQAGYSNTTAQNQTFVGCQTGVVSTGADNTCIGSFAGYNLTTGTRNTFVGAAYSGVGASGYYVTTGSKNTILGAYNGNQGGLDIRTASNNIVLSDGDGNPRVKVDGSGYFFVQTMPTTANGANCNISTGEGNKFYVSTSALKYKQDIRDIESIDINLFRPVRYKSKCEGDDQTKDFFGFIADEVHDAGITELISYGADGEVNGFQYDRLTVVLVKAIQELNAKVEAQAAEIAALKGQA